MSVYDTALLPHWQMPARTNVSVLCANASHDKGEGQLPLQGFGVRQLMAFEKRRKKDLNTLKETLRFLLT